MPVRRVNSLPNVCFLVARENQAVGRKHPRLYLAELPNGGWARARATNSHLILKGDEWLYDRNVKRGFTSFADLRSKLTHREAAGGPRAGSTVKHYLGCAQKFVEHFDGRSPMKLGLEEIRSFVEHLEKRDLSHQRVGQFLAAIKFLYGRTLGRPHEVAWISFPRNPQSRYGIAPRPSAFIPARLLSIRDQPHAFCVSPTCDTQDVRRAPAL